MEGHESINIREGNLNIQNRERFLITQPKQDRATPLNTNRCMKPSLNWTARMNIQALDCIAIYYNQAVGEALVP